MRRAIVGGPKDDDPTILDVSALSDQKRAFDSGRLVERSVWASECKGRRCKRSAACGLQKSREASRIRQTNQSCRNEQRVAGFAKPEVTSEQ